LIIALKRKNQGEEKPLKVVRQAKEMETFVVLKRNFAAREGRLGGKRAGLVT